MPEHGDATPRDRLARAAEEAFSFAHDRQSAKVHVMSAYEGAERERFAQAVYAAIDALADHFTEQHAGDASGFVRDILAEFDRINAA